MVGWGSLGRLTGFTTVFIADSGMDEAELMEHCGITALQKRVDHRPFEMTIIFHGRRLCRWRAQSWYHYGGNGETLWIKSDRTEHFGPALVMTARADYYLPMLTATLGQSVGTASKSNILSSVPNRKRFAPRLRLTRLAQLSTPWSSES